MTSRPHLMIGHCKFYLVTKISRYRGTLSCENFEVLDVERERYYVSRFGKVWDNKLKKLIGRLDSEGYVNAYVKFEGGLATDIRVARLVMCTFKPSFDPSLFPDHINTVPFDNRTKNLRWVTSKQNSNNKRTLAKFRNPTPEIRQKRSESGRLGGGSPNAKLATSKAKSIAIDQFSKSGEFIRRFKSGREASLITGVGVTGISDCATGKQKTSGGFVWRKADKDKEPTK